MIEHEPVQPDEGCLDRRRELTDLQEDSNGQLITEWVLLTALIVMPMIILIPSLLGMIRLYFYRTAEVISLPFP
ncbi:MAG: hypothetical protein ACI82F_001151 [Planctomycetota bacterium]|jgi:hypothetical protein